MGDVPPDFVQELWVKVRPHAVEQADHARRSAQAWALDGDLAAWDALVEEAHQLAGSLGSFGQWEASSAASSLDALLRTSSPDPAAVVEAAMTLGAAVERT